MPHYSGQFQDLKPLIEKQNFSSEQLTAINKLMRGCWKLRTAALCSAALGYALPDKFSIVEDKENPIEGYNGKTFFKTYVLKEGEKIPAQEANEELEKSKESGEI